MCEHFINIQTLLKMFTHNVKCVNIFTHMVYSCVRHLLAFAATASSFTAALAPTATVTAPLVIRFLGVTISAVWAVVAADIFAEKAWQTCWRMGRGDNALSSELVWIPWKKDENDVTLFRSAQGAGRKRFCRLVPNRLPENRKSGGPSKSDPFAISGKPRCSRVLRGWLGCFLGVSQLCSA